MVCWNTEDLVNRSYFSVRQFHPTMPLIIVDGSSPNMPCYHYLNGLRDGNLTIVHWGSNIGHGRGLAKGFEMVKTPFALTIDSDIVMLKSPVQDMLEMMEDDTYGVGWSYPTDITGHEYGDRPEFVDRGSMRYLHPYFCLIQIKEYKKYSPFIHHGAPAVQTMLDIHRRGLSDKVIKEFPGLGHTSGKGLVWEGKPSEWVRHDTSLCYDHSYFGGTGTKRVRARMTHIDGAWESVRDPMTGVMMR